MNQKAKVLGYDLPHGQQQIVGAILDPKIKRLQICAMTRYGKTRAVAIALLLCIVYCKQLFGKPIKILLIAPTIDQTNIIRNYIAELIAANPVLSNLVDTTGRGSAEHLRKEVSKKRVTWKNGCEILTLTAHGAGEEAGKQLMGFGGDIIVPDEAALILDEVYRKRISRMLGDNPNSKLIELVNPWNKLNFAWRHWKNPRFKRIHIDWQQALQEGRITQEFVDEQRAELSDYEFKVLYDSLYAEDSEDTLIRWNWIEHAKQTTITPEENWKSVWGLDVAEHGKDLTILTKCLTNGVKYKEIERHIIKEKETMDIANAVHKIVPIDEEIRVDSIGVGAGVYSRLTELGHKTVSIRGSQSPTRQTDRYLNQKAQRYWQLRVTFENQNIEILNDPKLVSQLSQMRYEFTAAGKIKIVDPEKSPDFSDSLSLCILTSGNVHVSRGKVPW